MRNHCLMLIRPLGALGLRMTCSPTYGLNGEDLEPIVCTCGQCAAAGVCVNWELGLVGKCVTPLLGPIPHLGAGVIPCCVAFCRKARRWTKAHSGIRCIGIDAPSPGCLW